MCSYIHNATYNLIAFLVAQWRGIINISCTYIQNSHNNNKEFQDGNHCTHTSHRIMISCKRSMSKNNHTRENRTFTQVCSSYAMHNDILLNEMVIIVFRNVISSFCINLLNPIHGVHYIYNMGLRQSMCRLCTHPLAFIVFRILDKLSDIRTHVYIGQKNK